MLDITNLMNDLACDRPVFHSEADFQHALAWCIHDAIPDGGVRLEFKPFPAEPMYLDIWLPGIGVAVELKYKTRKLNLLREGESFALRDQSAQDISRYDFLKDIQRLEQLRKLPNARVGFTVLLTNDPSYWKHPSRPAALVRGCGQAYALQTVEPVTYRCGTRRVCQARSSGSERYTRARPHAVAPMNCVPEDSRRRSTCTGRTHSPRARADGHQTPSSTVAGRAPSPS